MRRLNLPPARLFALGGAAALAVLAEGAMSAWNFHPLLDLTPVATLAAGLMMARRGGDAEAPAVVAQAAPPVAAATPPTSLVARRERAEDAPENRRRAEAMATKLSAERCITCVTRAAAKHGEEDLRALGVYTDFADRQITSVIGTTENAVNVISSNVSDADARISKLLTVLRRSASEDEVGRAVQAIEEQIETCRRLISRFTEDQREASEQSDAQRAKVLQETAEVLKSLESVDHIARSTTMMSINVSIEAAHAGAAGKGFMVIAKEIRDLAASTQALASDVGARMGLLQKAVNVDLGEDARRRDEVARKAFAEVSETLSSFLQNVLAIVRHERKALHEIEQEEEAIGSAIITAMGQMQFHDIIRQQLEQLVSTNGMVHEHLAEVGAAIAERRDPSLSGMLLEKLENQKDGYHLDSQRDSHGAAFRRTATASSVPKIEMF